MNAIYCSKFLSKPIDERLFPNMFAQKKRKRLPYAKTLLRTFSIIPTTNKIAKIIDDTKKSSFIENIKQFLKETISIEMDENFEGEEGISETPPAD